MKILYFLQKTFLENLREWKILIMVLVFAPFFVFLMRGYFAAADPVYRLVILNEDAAMQNGLSEALIETWQNAVHPDGKTVFRISRATALPEALEKIKTGDADLVVQIEKDFGARLVPADKPENTTIPGIVNHSDPANTRGAMAMAYSDYIAFTFAFEVTDTAPPLDVAAMPLGKADTLSEFDLYVPALLVLAIIMVLFTAAATLIREMENQTMIRLRMSRLSTAQMMIAVSINQVLIGIVALVLAVIAAILMGYRPMGSMIHILPIGALGVLGIVAIGLLLAAFLKTMFELLTVGVFPFFILMFFSDCMFPLPKIPIVSFFDNTLYANDILPTSLVVRAFNRILNTGALLTDIWFELVSLTIITLVYFVVAMLIFKRRV